MLCPWKSTRERNGCGAKAGHWSHLFAAAAQEPNWLGNIRSGSLGAWSFAEGPREEPYSGRNTKSKRKAPGTSGSSSEGYPSPVRIHALNRYYRLRVYSDHG